MPVPEDMMRANVDGAVAMIRAAADAGADGVIVGSRLVRAAGEEADGAAAVGRLVGEFAAALA